MSPQVPANSATMMPLRSASSAALQVGSGRCVEVNPRLTLSEFACDERAICTLSLFSTKSDDVSNSYAPASQKLGLPASGRANPRWSVVNGKGVGDDWSVQLATGIKSTASLFGLSAIVCVGPPLFCNPSGSRCKVVLSLTLVPLKPQVPSSEILYPSSVTAAPQLPPVLSARTVP